MEQVNKKKYLLGILVSILVIGIGTTFAYFATRSMLTGSGTTAEGTTVSLGDTTVNIEGSLDFNDLNIYPGHKTVSRIKVTATGDKNVLYNLIWDGTNTLKTSLNYAIYKTSTEENPTIKCTKKQEGNLETIFYEECTEANFANLGEVVSSGVIPSIQDSSIRLVRNESIQATSSGETVYYYVVLEYPNKEESQNIDMNGSFNGEVTIELIEQELIGKDLILASNIIDNSRSDGHFGSAFEEETVGKIFSAEDDDETTYFFAGSNPNNWVQFGTNTAGQRLYWRIIRINGDESIRIIYNGSTTDQTGTTTQIGTSAFNTSRDDNAYVGYMYGTAGSSTYAETHANMNSSTIKTYLDTWYEENLKTNYEEYIDINAGFCGDRTVDNYTSGYTGDGSGTTKTEYASKKRAFSTYTATYKCSNSNDYYTVSSANKGNKALENPIGLITSDEVMYAGGKTGTRNLSYWLTTGQWYWILSPSSFGAYAYVQIVHSDGILSHRSMNYLDGGVRPVINLKSNALTTGSGTTTDPYRIAE